MPLWAMCHLVTSHHSRRKKLATLVKLLWCPSQTPPWSEVKGRLTFQHLPKFKPKLTRGHWTTRSTDTTGQQNPHRILRLCLQSKHKRMTDRTHDVDGVLVGSKCQCCFLLFVEMLKYPIGSMYGIFTYIYHKNQPNVGKYIIHGSYGYGKDEKRGS